MAYIPESHKKYNLLQPCEKQNLEIIICDENSDLFYGIWELLPDDEKFMPDADDPVDCFYASQYRYSEYYALLDNLVSKYGHIEGETGNLGEMLTEFKALAEKVNVKENWSICRYVGESTCEDDDAVFTHGQYYYWACTKEPLQFYGIIDDEGLVVSKGDPKHDYRKPAFPFEIDNKLWEIAEDPTGIAERILW